MSAVNLPDYDPYTDPAMVAYLATVAGDADSGAIEDDQTMTARLPSGAAAIRPLDGQQSGFYRNPTIREDEQERRLL